MYGSALILWAFLRGCNILVRVCVSAHFMLFSCQGCKCGKTSTCTRTCECRKFGKVCNPRLCGCDQLVCKNDRDHALVDVSRTYDIGHWITRSVNGRRMKIYIDAKGKEYVGYAAIKRSDRDKNGAQTRSKSKTKKKARKKPYKITKKIAEKMKEILMKDLTTDNRREEYDSPMVRHCFFFFCFVVFRPRSSFTEGHINPT